MSQKTCTNIFLVEFLQTSLKLEMYTINRMGMFLLYSSNIKLYIIKHRGKKFPSTLLGSVDEPEN